MKHISHLNHMVMEAATGDMRNLAMVVVVEVVEVVAWEVAVEETVLLEVVQEGALEGVQGEAEVAAVGVAVLVDTCTKKKMDMELKGFQGLKSHMVKGLNPYRLGLANPDPHGDAVDHPGVVEVMGVVEGEALLVEGHIRTFKKFPGFFMDQWL
jgi:hypothetical protein